ncbi:uncharacterized protein LOC143911596 [Arctopsyche grandis]|uniref:uncharacterized protein LOC143911596 n=1 Tax=Arctopsyche grandis TaxID=121162 RepID=UPI00406D9A27
MTSERSIPHLRDIFSLGGQPFHQHSGYSEISSYANPKNLDNFNDTVNENKKSTKKTSKKAKSKDNYKTLTNGDVKTLERHLSMKKTIRKKIMRDLSQAFVEDPNEFKIEDSTPEQLKAELSAEAMKFGEKHNRKRGEDSNFLDMLRGDTKGAKSTSKDDCEYSALGKSDPDNPEEAGAQGVGEKTSFWKRFTMKNKNKR